MTTAAERNQAAVELSMSSEQPQQSATHDDRQDAPRESTDGDATGQTEDGTSIPSAQSNHRGTSDLISREEEGRGEDNHQPGERFLRPTSDRSAPEASSPPATTRSARYRRQFASERRKLQQGFGRTGSAVPGATTAGISAAPPRRSSLAKMTVTTRRSTAPIQESANAEALDPRPREGEVSASEENASSLNGHGEPELWRQVARMRRKIAQGPDSAASATVRCDGHLEIDLLAPPGDPYVTISTSSPPQERPFRSSGLPSATRRDDTTCPAPALVEARSVFVYDSGLSDELGVEQGGPRVAEVTEVVDATPLASMFWRNVMYAVLALAVIAIAVGTSLGVAGRPSGSSPAYSPTPPPSASPTLSPLMLAFANQVPDYSQVVLDDPESPQSRALEWLAAQYEGQSSDAGEQRFSRMRQQFALATLFYATSGGGSWVESESWLNATVHECDWFGCACTDAQAIESLSLGDNRLDGTLPRELGLLTKLHLLDLSSNVLWGRIPSEMGILADLTYFNLEMNSQTGSIPTTVGMLTSLETLRLNSNPDLTGILPTHIGQLVHLQALYLDNTGIGGAIPTYIGRLGQLEEWSMHDCALNGTIPTEIGGLTNVTRLELYNNRGLTGPIPSQLGLLLELEYLTLDSCSLSGRIPSELGRLTTLLEFNISSNHLTGSVPVEVCNLVSSGLQFSVDKEVTCS